jgi:hypothetical protein
LGEPIYVEQGYHLPFFICGGFPIRLAKTQHLDKQRDSEKKEKRHSKELREKRPNPGSFWFTAVGWIFFQRHKREQY